MAARNTRVDQRRGRADAGAGATDYIAVLLLVAAIAAVIAGSGVGGTVVGRIDAALCRVSPAGCEDGRPPGDGTTTEGQSEEPISTEEWGGRSTDPGRRPPDPTDREREAGEEAAEDIRDYFDHDCDWYQVFGCDGPVHPADVLRDMSPGALAALFGELSDDEIRRLLQVDGVADILRLRADPYLLRRIEQLAAGSIEPTFSDVRDGDGKKPSDPATDYGHIPNGQIFGPSGEPRLTDIDQGSLGDCWWLASMGALAQTEEGRALIQNMIRQNPNGTYTVTFPDGDKVTITPFFPIKENGDIAYAQPGNPPVLWPLILEKALAQKDGGYGELVIDSPERGMEILTGQSGHTQELGDSGGVSLDRLREWIDDGVAITASSLDDTEGNPAYEGDNARLVSDHIYVVRGITSNGKVRLYNPWGNKHVTLTIEELNTLFGHIAVNPVR